MQEATRIRIIELFRQRHGYASFQELRQEKVTIKMINELLEEGQVQKVCRGWYWCNVCGFKKPRDYQCIEIAKADADAVICLDSACYFHDLITEEPQELHISTERSDRKQFQMEFPVSRHYLTRKNLEDEIIRVETEFGSYQVFGMERTVCDCIRMVERVPFQTRLEMLMRYRQREDRNVERLVEYGKNLKAGELMQVTLRSLGENV